MASADTHRLVGLCAAFFCLFFAFFAAQNQVSSTLGKYGTYSLSLLYGSFAISGIFAPAILRLLQRIATACCSSASSASSSSSADGGGGRLVAETFGLVLGSALYAPFLAACSIVTLHWGQLVGSALLGVGAGILWVSQGSLLNASCTEANRGRWSGIFWACFMSGNACGNFVTALLIRYVAGVSNSTVFLILAAVAALSSVLFAVLVRARPAGESPSALSVATAASDVGFLSSDHDDKTESLLLIPVAAAVDEFESELHESASTSEVTTPDSLLNDVRELLAVFVKPDVLVLLPVLLFIGAENSFWSGAYNGILGDAWGAEAVALVSGTLAVADILASIAAGSFLDKFGKTQQCGGWGSRLLLLTGLGAFVGALAIIVFCVRPAATAMSVSSSPPALAYVAGALMGCGDGIANTVITTRLGGLAEDALLLPRRTAFQFFQIFNVMMTCAGFFYMAQWPLGSSLVQVYILLTLIAASALLFALFARPVRSVAAVAAAAVVAAAGATVGP